MKQSILLGLLVLSLGNLHSQVLEGEAQSTSTLGLSIGFNQAYFKDIILSTLQYREVGLAYGLDYQEINSKGHIFRTHIDFSPGRLRTKVSKFFDADYLAGGINVDVLKRLNTSSTQKSTWHIGGGYHFRVYYLEYYEDEPGDEDAFSFFGSHSLTFLANWNYQIGSTSNFSASVGLPLFNLILRPAYNGFDNVTDDYGAIQRLTKGELGSFNKLITFDIDLRYQRKLLGHFHWVFVYQGRYQNARAEQGMVRFNSQIRTGPIYVF